MALDGREITISVRQSYPSAGGISQAADGLWPDGTYSIKVVAWYQSGEGREDNAGVIRDNVTSWVFTVSDSAGHTDDKITVTWTAANRPPDHYSVYYIEAGAWVANGTLRGRKVAQVNGDTLTVTITKPFTQQGASTNWVSTTTSEDGGSPSTVLHDTNATFIATGVKVGDTISNVTDASTAAVVSINSEIKLTTTALAGGGDNKYESGDTYRVTSSTLLIDTAATFVANGVAAGDYVILNAGASTVGAYAIVTSVDSEIQLTTAALTNSAAYVLNDSYDVVDKIFVISTSATSFTINPIKDEPFTLRQAIVKAFNGLGVAKSYAQASPFNKSRFEFYQISITEDDYKLATLWVAQTVRVRITESAGASALLPIRDGYFTGASHIPTRFKNSRFIYWLDFADETGSLT